MKKIHSLYILLLIFTCSCSEDFLNRLPQDQLSTSGSLASVNELRLYMNQFYEQLPNHPNFTGGEGIAYDDARTDNMIFTTVNPRLNGQLTISNATELSEYKQIRGLNFFLNQAKQAKGNAAEINQYLGEAYFFRAWFYFNLVKKYGDVSWVNSLLNAEDESTFLERDSRLVVVDSILKDLDRAGELLAVQSNNNTMRIHRDVAWAMSSRVALYEGTWQKYHQAKATGFASPGINAEKIISYLVQARDAAKKVMDAGRWQISSTGKPLEDYKNMFINTDLRGDKEVLLFRRYNPAENIGHGVSKYLSTAGGDIGITLSLVDDYLTREGKPFVGSEREQAQKTYGQELQPSLRDPRLFQTAGVAGQPLRPGAVVPSYPPINQSGFNRNTTGYPMYKYVEYSNVAATTDDGMSAAPVIYFRYAEVLLNYAEAVVELDGDVNLAVQALTPLRTRVGMPPVNIEAEYNTQADYPFRNLSKALQAVRRERRVEMVAEGTRLNDIMRWAAADVLLVGKRPLGALFVGSDLAAQNTSTGFYGDALLYFDTAPAGKSINFYLNGQASDSKRYIDPYKQVMPNGYGFKVNRDYLLPIQQRMLELTNGKWKQNPNW